MSAEALTLDEALDQLERDSAGWEIGTRFVQRMRAKCDELARVALESRDPLEAQKADGMADGMRWVVLGMIGLLDDVARPKAQVRADRTAARLGGAPDAARRELDRLVNHGAARCRDQLLNVGPRLGTRPRQRARTPRQRRTARTVGPRGDPSPEDDDPELAVIPPARFWADVDVWSKGAR
jgi:hypothetical protein